MFTRFVSNVDDLLDMKTYGNLFIQDYLASIHDHLNTDIVLI